MQDTLLLGEIACLSAALCWAVSVTLFRRPVAEQGAVTVNFGKNAIAAVLLGITALALGQLSGLATVSTSTLVAIVVSGWLGLSLGDSALFLAVGHIGVHRTLLCQTLAPIFTALLSYLLVDEVMSLLQAGGALLVLIGVAIVVAPGRGEERTSFAWIGLFWGAVSAFGQGAGVALTKTAMRELPIFAAAFLRQSAAVLGLIVVLALQRRLRHSLALFTSRSRFLSLLLPALLSAVIGFSLATAGIAWASAAVAAVLLATSPIFGLFVEARFGQGSITWRGLLGTTVAIAGVAVLVIP